MDESQGHITGVSRSGRVRKKSSKLADFDTNDESEMKTKRSSSSRGVSSGAITNEQQEQTFHQVFGLPAKYFFQFTVFKQILVHTYIKSLDRCK